MSMNNNKSSVSSTTPRPLAGLPKRVLRSTTKAALVAASSAASNSSPALDVRMTSLSLKLKLAQNRSSSPQAECSTTPLNSRKKLFRSASLKDTSSTPTPSDPCTPRPAKRVRRSDTPPPAPMRHPLGKPLNPKGAADTFIAMKKIVDTPIPARLSGGIKDSNERKRKRTERE